MEASAGGRDGVGTLAFRAGLVALAALALWFSIRNALHGLVERDFPAMGLAIGPASPVSAGVIALNRAAVKQGFADARARELMEQAARDAPLLAEPFIVAGLDASAREDFPRAQRLFEEAQRRDPRHVLPRYWLFDWYLRSGRYRQGVAEAQPLIRLQPAAAPATVAVLTALLDVPEGRAALLDAIRRGPIWRRAFFDQVAASPRLLGGGAALLRATAPEGAAGWSREYGSVLRGLVRARDYRAAYGLWLRALPAAARPAAPGVHDGDFAGRPGVEPFGWRLPGARRGATQAVEAEDAPAGTGLAIRSDGDRAATLAEQLVPVPAGPLRFSFAARALEDAAVGDAGLRAEVRCAADGAVVATTVLAAAPARLEPRTLDLDLPARCGAALVRFAIQPGIEPGPLNILLTGVKLSPR